MAGKVTAGGWGWTHQKARAHYKRLVDAGEGVCSRCGGRIAPGSKWHLDHTDDRTGYLGPAHAICNLRAAGRKAQRARRRAKREARTSAVVRPIRDKDGRCWSEPTRVGSRIVQHPISVVLYDWQAELYGGRVPTPAEIPEDGRTGAGR